ncbi:hypothetical protein [Polyangium fumosum]|uniref:Uncharacterized protein n=1 Tax=Polyangium fumosum TaxID=889272 RepID=A0A4U1JK62_9BACT|nr:hypothetical protein [Polyangium fumosum]TKD13134.1 hypothetical protein E8A74_00840 [Polyangium fumosum]
MGARCAGSPEGTYLLPQRNQLPHGDEKSLLRFLSFLCALVLLREEPPFDVLEFEPDSEREEHRDQG